MYASKRKRLAISAVQRTLSWLFHYDYLTIYYFNYSDHLLGNLSNTYNDFATLWKKLLNTCFSQNNKLAPLSADLTTCVYFIKAHYYRLTISARRYQSAYLRRRPAEPVRNQKVRSKYCSLHYAVNKSVLRRYIRECIEWCADSLRFERDQRARNCNVPVFFRDRGGRRPRERCGIRD